MGLSPVNRDTPIHFISILQAALEYILPAMRDGYGSGQIFGYLLCAIQQFCRIDYLAVNQLSCKAGCKDDVIRFINAVCKSNFQFFITSDSVGISAAAQLGTFRIVPFSIEIHLINLERTRDERLACCQNIRNDWISHRFSGVIDTYGPGYLLG
ncbi:hypothetical protein D3C75_840030 [compost metagenome]